MLNIVKYPIKVLRTKAKKVQNILNPEVQAFIKEMKETMLSADGLGLAANQVNKDIRILVINDAEGPKAFINPFIYWKTFAKDIAEEGCLSFPQVYGLVKRSQGLNLFFRDEKGELRHLKAKGLLARVLQHEIDHLNGVLFIDKVIEYTKNEKSIKEWQLNAKKDEL